MLVFSIFVINVQAQKAATTTTEKAKTEQTVSDKAPHAGCQHAKDGEHKCTGKCTGDKTNKKCCTDKKTTAGCCDKSKTKGCSSHKTEGTTSNTKAVQPKAGCTSTEAKPGCCSHKK